MVAQPNLFARLDREPVDFPGHAGPVTSVAFSPKGDRIISGGQDGTLRLWDLKGQQIGKAFEGHQGTVFSVAFSPKGDRILSGGDDGTVRLWDLKGQQITEPLTPNPGKGVYGIAVYGEKIVAILRFEITLISLITPNEWLASTILKQ